MEHGFLLTVVVLLGAAVLAVPLARRMGVGGVIGYLGAGLVVGPAGLSLVSDVQNIAHAAELGVAMLLFLIGLELKPARLWVMRRAVFLFGALQVAVTAALLAAGAVALGLGPVAALVVGYGLALSSTALVLPLLAERRLLGSPAGRDAFGALLFQDLAVIPMIAALPMLAGQAGEEAAPDWAELLRGAAILAAIFIAGRFLVGPLFRAVEAAKTTELFSATALLIVLGTALLAEAAGLSMSLGAFLAGVLLSDSEYRHELQADIEPFEGLLLGLFFVAMGMSVHLAPLVEAPLAVAGAAAGLIGVKGAAVFALARLLGHDAKSAVRLAVALAQGGEFALVLFAFATGGGALAPQEAQWISLVAILSMAATPILFAATERGLARLGKGPARPFDEMPDEAAPVIICGFGRVGQVVGRILRVGGVPFTALDASPEQVDVVRRFGHKIYYGDPSRRDLMRAAGAERAKVLVVAVDDVEQSLKIVDVARRAFPHLHIFARARDRRHAHLLMDRAVEVIVRETFHSSLELTEALLVEVGLGAEPARRLIETFRERDERTLREQHAIYRDEKQLIQSTQAAAAELEALMRADRPASAPQVDERDAGGGERHS